MSLPVSVEPSQQRNWNPAVFGEHVTLHEVYRDMPRDPAQGVPWIVRMLENPRSPVALPGAVALFDHDCIHALLGRGLLQQDEAFVIGFTMGTVRAHRRWHVEFFKFCARRIYRDEYRFAAIDAEVFDHGVQAARTSGASDLTRIDFRNYLTCSLAELRRSLGVRPDLLARAYRAERRRFPHTRASARLGERVLLRQI